MKPRQETLTETLRETLAAIMVADRKEAPNLVNRAIPICVAKRDQETLTHILNRLVDTRKLAPIRGWHPNEVRHEISVSLCEPFGVDKVRDIYRDKPDVNIHHYIQKSITNAYRKLLPTAATLNGTSHTEHQYPSFRIPEKGKVTASGNVRLDACESIHRFEGGLKRDIDHEAQRPSSLRTDGENAPKTVAEIQAWAADVAPHYIETHPDEIKYVVGQLLDPTDQALFRLVVQLRAEQVSECERDKRLVQSGLVPSRSAIRDSLKRLEDIVTPRWRAATTNRQFEPEPELESASYVADIQADDADRLREAIDQLGFENVKHFSENQLEKLARKAGIPSTGTVEVLLSQF